MRGKREEGIALIAVLWMLMLLSIIAAALSLEVHFSTRIARNMAENAAARAAADAGIQRAILDLISVKKFRTDGTIYAWQFGNWTVHISVQDEVGKVNLNQAPEELLAALFGAVGVDSGKAQSLADAIVDFRDPDNLVRPHGAEEAEYRAAGVAWGPKNARFETVRELQQVLGMTLEIYERVAPYLTIYSIGGLINPTLAGEWLTGTLQRAGFNNFINFHGMSYSIHADAESSNGAAFDRDAIVQLNLQPANPVLVLDWRQSAPKNSHNALAEQ
jgi:general secretion pathway protein K